MGYSKKTIKKAILYKLNDWLKTIDDENFRAEIKNNVIVTGGCIASMLLGEEPNDYDVYFKNYEVAEKVAKFYTEKCVNKSNLVSKIKYVKNDYGGLAIFIKSAGILTEETNASYAYFESLPENFADNFLDKILTYDKNSTKKYHVQFITDNAITLSDGIQIILRFVGDQSVIHKYFDYTHCKNWFSVNDGLVLNQKALESLLTMQLEYSGSEFPICSLFRMRKFLNRGFKISVAEIFKMAYDCSKLDLSNPITLREQLTGVDTAYFMEVLSIINNNNGQTLDRSYLFKVLDRVFADEEILNVSVDTNCSFNNDYEVDF